MLVKCISPIDGSLVHGEIYIAEDRDRDYYIIHTLAGKRVSDGGGWLKDRFVVLDTPDRCKLCDASTPGRTICCECKGKL
jgi:hypothetical protein